MKLYILIILPFAYILNKILLDSKVDLDDFSKRNSELYEKNLNFLFQFFNSDKGDKYKNQYQKPIKFENKFITGHKYHKYYEKYFLEKKNENLQILEIGTFKGNATAAFYFYFKNASITSVDIFPDLMRYKSKRIRNFFLNNSSEKELNEKILSKNTEYDIIIEDAGHYHKDQIITLFGLFKSLKKKGLFIIEELDFPDTRIDMNPEKKKPTLRDILFSIQNKKDFSSEFITKDQKEYFLKNLNCIDVYRGEFNQIAFIQKK